MPRKSCCCGGGNYIAIPCRAWGHAVFVGYQGLTAIQGASGMLGYNEYFGPTATALFKNPNSIFGLSGPFAGQHPFYKFYSGGFVVGNAGFGSPTPAPLKIAGFTGCTDTGPGGQNWGGYNGTTCYEAIFVTDNDRPVYYKLWGAGGGGISTSLYGGNGAFTQVPGVYNENNIACVGFGGFGNDMVKNFTGWANILPTYNGGGGQGYPAWGGGAAFVSVSSFYPEDNVAVVGAGGGAGEVVPGPGHGGALAGKDATPPEGGKGAVDVAAGFGGCGAQSGIFYSGGRGSKSSTGAIFYGGGGGGGGLGGGGGGGITGYAGGGGSSEVTEWARSGTDQGPPNICDPYFWIGATDLASSVGGKIFGGFGGYVSGRVPAAGAPENTAEFGMSGKVAVVYSSMKCVCDGTLDTIPEQTYICLNQNQYDSIIQQARGSSACYGSTISFGGATGLSAFGGVTSGFLQWTFGEGGDVPKMISFYYGAELYYLLGQCSSLCDPAYQVPEDASLTLTDCREYGACCQARLATPYCKIPTSGPGIECFDAAYQCPSDCQPIFDKPSPFYICDTNEENADMPDSIFWTKKNGYYYLVTPTQGWIPFGEQLYPTEIISEIILEEPCCSDTQEGCSGGIDTTTPSNCCVVLDKQFDGIHPGRATVNVNINYNGYFGKCSLEEIRNINPYECCTFDGNYTDTINGVNIAVNEYFIASPTTCIPSGLPPECSPGETITQDNRSLYYQLYDDGLGEEELAFTIRSVCSCATIESTPYIQWPYGDCPEGVPTAQPIIIVKNARISDIIAAAQSLSNGRYNVTAGNADDFYWIGEFRAVVNNFVIPADYMERRDFYNPIFNSDGSVGLEVVHEYWVKSPKYYAFVSSLGKGVSNCDCNSRPAPGFIQSNGNVVGQTDCESKTRLPQSKALIDWEIDPNATMFVTSTVNTIYPTNGFGICENPYVIPFESCVLDDFDSSTCTFVATG